MPIKVLPAEILTQIVVFAGATPLDLVRLGGCSPTLLKKKDTLAHVAAQDVLWLPFTPPSFREVDDRTPLSVAFAARMRQKESTLRRKIFAEYRQIEENDGPRGFVPSSSCRATTPTNGLSWTAEDIAHATDAYARNFDDFDFALTWAQECCQYDSSANGPAEDALLRGKSVWLDEPALMKLALDRCGRSIRFAGPKLFANESFLRSALSAPMCLTCWNEKEHWQSWAFPLNRVAPELLKKRDFVESVLTVRPQSFSRLPEKLQNDGDLLLFALRARKNLWPAGHKDIFWSEPGGHGAQEDEAINSPIYYAESLGSEISWVRKAMAIDVTCLEDLGDAGEIFFHDLAFVVEALKLGQQQGQKKWTHQLFGILALYYQGAFLRATDDEETMLCAVTSLDDLCFVSDRLRRDKVFCEQVGAKLGGCGALFSGVKPSHQAFPYANLS